MTVLGGCPHPPAPGPHPFLSPSLTPGPHPFLLPSLTPALRQLQPWNSQFSSRHFNHRPITGRGGL
eukprot:364547-Chlamydomonas_euryale.AAC.2